MNKNDWTCKKCNFIIFGKKTHCHKCGTIRSNTLLPCPKKAYNDEGLYKHTIESVMAESKKYLDPVYVNSILNGKRYTQEEIDEYRENITKICCRCKVSNCWKHAPDRPNWSGKGTILM